MPMFHARNLSLLLPFMLQLGLIPACSSDKEKDTKKALERQVQSEQNKNAAIQQEKAGLEREASLAAEKLRANESSIAILNKNKGDTEAEKLRLSDANLKLQSEIDRIAKDLKALDSQLAASSLALKNKDKEISVLTKQLSLAKTNIEKLNKEKDQQATLVLNYEKQIAEKSAKIAEMIAGSNEPKIVELRDQVAASQKELEGARAESLELNNSLAKEKEYSKDLERQIEELNAFQFHADPVQVFLANAGKDSLFVVEPESLTGTYSIADNKSCTFIFNINRSIDVVRGDAQNNIPKLANRTMLPIKASYQKVVVCKEGAKVETQIENGSIYQSIANNSNNAIQLVSARENSSCDGLEVNKDLGVFGGTFQQFYPYRGQIDGIETIDFLRPSKELLRYNMGSSAFDFRGSSCTAVLADGVATDLSLLACRIALGQEPGVETTKGCFTEVKEADKTQIIFTAAQ